MKSVALITGASSGIGAELARIHAARGGDLVLVARREDRLQNIKQELESEHGVQVLLVVEDLNNEAAPDRIYERVTSEGIALEYLINNAGFGGRGRFDQRNWSEDRSMIQVNVIALTALTRLFLPGFVERGHGRILNVSSTAALLPGPLQAVYYASKAYVTSFSNALAEELRGKGVTVTALMPGATASEFAEVSGMDKTDVFDKTVSPRQVAEEAYQGLLAGRLDVISGLKTSERIALRIAPLLPKQVLLKQIHQLQRVNEE